MNKLRKQLERIDGKGYKAYKDISGHYDFVDYTLYIDYVQGDPFASPSRIRIIAPRKKTIVEPEWFDSAVRRVRTEDMIARKVGDAIRRTERHAKGTGKSGLVSIDIPGQKVIERAAVSVTEESITICLSIGLPAQGRKVLGRQAINLLLHQLPDIVKNSVFALSKQIILEALHLADQQEAIREHLTQNGYVGFVANGSILPRESGISDRPMKNEAVQFESPKSMEVSLTIPHRTEPLQGMAVKEGITLIVGGGYHGKSTLLHAMEHGVYDHILGDGREYVITNHQAMKIRSEDGRKVTGVDISPFINNLPYGKDTRSFTSENASGSTSQAANIIEAIEAGSDTLLIDEDTSATNFMIRDYRMQQLVAKEKEPITPFIDRVKQLRTEHHISTVLVMGGSGDYFDVADQVILMENYLPYDVTDQARSIVKESERRHEGGERFGEARKRVPEQSSLNSKKGKKSKVTARGLHHIQFGNTDVSLLQIEQLVDPSQTRFAADVLHFLERNHKLGEKSIPELLDFIDQKINAEGLGSFSLYKNQHPGDIARIRRTEMAAILNRIRTLRIK
ncbi:ABC-ATPase domain-containing protein [Alkalihalobacillus hwajinpoensis]|uniref:ABC-ATPase domain-containing protein n=1 Tax=Guptibacillus hwajinpoensis TaxID=208199 RepID=UPI00188362B5|nr:ABC-ATPase domain-containing protein [Pseudalkalibacillus hwajinpoensis]MBF0706950.1 ABC-ATPase domain-containing protein [Pseudalkalibacillus hwajinpoensis]